MLPQAKVTELVEILVDVLFDGQATDAVLRTLNDTLDDALHDAYGHGEADERARVVAYLKEGEKDCDKYADFANIIMAGYSPAEISAKAALATWEAISRGQHDPPDPDRLKKLTPSFVPKPEK